MHPRMWEGEHDLRTSPCSNSWAWKVCEYETLLRTAPQWRPVPQSGLRLANDSGIACSEDPGISGEGELAGDGLLLALCLSWHGLLGSGYLFGLRSGDAFYLVSFCEVVMCLPVLKHPCPLPCIQTFCLRLYRNCCCLFLVSLLHGNVHWAYPASSFAS